MPCCWPPTLIADTSVPAGTASWTAATSATHQSCGSWMSCPVWGARPSPTISPVSRSTARTLVDWVLESTPSTTLCIIVSLVCTELVRLAIVRLASIRGGDVYESQRRYDAKECDQPGHQE